MKIKYLLIGGLFLLSPFFASAAANLVISQVQVSGDGGAGDEYIELYNPAESPADLSGWSIQYKSATGNLPLSSGKKNLPEIIIPAGKYYLIANSGYNGSISADLTHSSFSLSGSASGATIFLSNSTQYVQSCADPFIVDHLSYGTGVGNCPEVAGAPLPQSEYSLARIGLGTDTDDNAADFVVIPSNPRALGAAPVASEPSVETEKKKIPVAYTQSLVISEFLPNPEGADSGEEWVELFNPSNEIVELTGWKLDDKAATGDKVGETAFVFPADAKVMPNGYYTANLGEENFGLTNFGGDEVRLIWPDGGVATRVLFETDAPEEQSLVRKQDGSYAWTITPTKNHPNVIADGKPLNPVVKGVAIPNGEILVRIVAAVPNPKGPDSGKEWVKLFNDSDFPLNLAGWILDDGKVEDKIGSSAYVLDPLALDPRKEVVIVIPAGKFALNNTGEDHIRLFNPQKVLINEVGFLEAKEGKVLIFNAAAGPTTSEEPAEPLPAAAPSVSLEVDAPSPQKEGLVEGIQSLPRTGLDPTLCIRIFVFFGLLWYIFRVISHKYHKEASADPGG